jgi:spermidine synthase
MVPVLVAPRLGSALVIGLGSGYSAHVLHDLGFGALEVADISPGIVQASRDVFGDFNHHVADAPNVRITLEDGRNHLLLTDRRYDVISMEITNVWFAGATSVYSREFYAAAKEHLTPGGVLQQWVQLHHLTMDEVGSILATLRSELSYVELYVQGGQGIVLASAEPLAVRAVGVQAFYAYPRPTERSADDALSSILRARVLASEDVERLVQASRWVINTDWNRYLEYATPRYATVRHDFMTDNLLALQRAGSGAPLGVEPGVPERVRDIVASRR